MCIKVPTAWTARSMPMTLEVDTKMGMRGMVMKNHWESTAALVYMTRKEVPGIELFGGITQDLAVGGINLEAVKHMVAMKGGWGRVIWLPTFDAEHVIKSANGTGPFVRVSENGDLLPSVLELIDFIAQHHDLVLETGHVSAEEGDRWRTRRTSAELRT